MPSSAWRAVAYDQAALQQRKRTERHPLRLYGAIDATKVHTHGQDDHPWRDLKVGAWFEARGRPPQQPDGQWRIQAENIHYYADICSATEFGHLLWTTGVQHHAVVCGCNWGVLRRDGEGNCRQHERRQQQPSVELRKRLCTRQRLGSRRGSILL